MNQMVDLINKIKNNIVLGGIYLMRIHYKMIDKIYIDLFSKFNRYQDVKKCWRKEDGKWILKEVPFTEQWGVDEYRFLVNCLKNTIETGGTVFGAYDDVLVGFSSIKSF